MRGATLFIVAAAFPMVLAGAGQTGELDRVIGTNVYGATITGAIATGDFAVRLAEATGVPIVCEASRDATQHVPAVVTLTSLTGREALNLLTPDYIWRQDNGVIVVRSMREWSDPRDPLNQQSPPIDWKNVNAQHVLEFIGHVLYREPTTQPTFQPSGVDRRFDLKVSGTVIDVLVASARADGDVVWTIPWPPPDGNVDHFAVSVRGVSSARGMSFVRPIVPPIP